MTTVEAVLILLLIFNHWLKKDFPQKSISSPLFKGRKAIYSGFIQKHSTEPKPNFMQIKGQNDGGLGGRSSRVDRLSSGKELAGLREKLIVFGCGPSLEKVIGLENMNVCHAMRIGWPYRNSPISFTDRLYPQKQ